MIRYKVQSVIIWCRVKAHENPRRIRIDSREGKIVLTKGAMRQLSSLFLLSPFLLDGFTSKPKLSWILSLSLSLFSCGLSFFIFIFTAHHFLLDSRCFFHFSFFLFFFSCYYNILFPYFLFLPIFFYSLSFYIRRLDDRLTQTEIDSDKRENPMTLLYLFLYYNLFIT